MMMKLNVRFLNLVILVFCVGVLMNACSKNNDNDDTLKKFLGSYDVEETMFNYVVFPPDTFIRAYIIFIEPSEYENEVLIRNIAETGKVFAASVAGNDLMIKENDYEMQGTFSLQSDHKTLHYEYVYAVSEIGEGVGSKR